METTRYTGAKVTAVSVKKGQLTNLKLKIQEEGKANPLGY